MYKGTTAAEPKSRGTRPGEVLRDENAEEKKEQGHRSKERKEYKPFKG